MNRCVHALVVRLLTAVFVCIVSCERGSAQAQSAADGPWAGWAQCVLTGQLTSQGQSYFHQQTHTWVLTGSTPGPASTSAIKQYAATWQVTGQGTRDRGQGRSEQWTTVGQPTPDTLTIRMTAEGTVRIGSAAQLRSTGTTTGATIPYVDEWTFPVIEGAATPSSITGSAPQGLSANFPGAPPGTTSTVTCSWNFVRGGAVPSPPAPQSVSQLGLKPPAPIAVPAPAGTTAPALPGGVLVIGPPQPPPTIATLPGGSLVVPAPSPAPSGATGTISPTVPTLNGGVIAVNRSPTGTLTAFTYSDPTGFRADQIDDGTVKLTWNAATGVSTYMVGGPGTNNGVQVTGTTYTVKGISAGTQTWSIASLPVVTAFDKWPTATASVVSPFSGVAAAPVSATTTTPGRQAFTTSGTFTVPNGVTRVTVELWGAGAGGSGAPPVGHGGGGGAYTRIVVAVSQGASLRIVIGAGGAGGAAGTASSSPMNGANGSSTQLMLQGNVLAEADGGKGDGTGGRKSSASGVVALAGLDGKPPQPIYYPSDGTIYTYSAGPGGGAVTGSVAPVGTTGGRGGYSQQVCYDLYLSNCGYENYPGGAGLAGYALISY